MPIEVRELQVSVEKTKEVAKDLERRMDDAEKLLNKHDDMTKDLGQRVAKLEKAKNSFVSALGQRKRYVHDGGRPDDPRSIELPCQTW